MKKLLFAFCSFAAVIGAFGQGQILSQNDGNHAITNSTTGARAATGTMVGFYGNPNPNATTASPGWVLAGGTTNLISPGIFFGQTRIYQGFPIGVEAAFQVRAWLTTASFPNYEAAKAGDPTGRFGESVVMRITPNDPAGTAPAPTMVGAGLQGFTVNPVPEPSSIALGLLGLGAIVLFRRRK